ncbi:MAG: sulfurtransferase [Comamonas sp.]|jgi:rhodanese-related sulfurtransferase|uniref:rhodanese-like domain-containing protein n=1 Tax=Comamonas sp. TaxID=34028 RepID=UPI0028392E3D|nr:rhodanese-like domain-containing protein [Comamonas sp.]MDR0216924.1 sulfurtransferase [Comamonas sp.]MDR2299368.1 sulfurtransferase [Comamonas sp.]
MLTQVLPAQFQQWLAPYTAKGVAPVVLDVREPWEIAQSSIRPGEGFELRSIPMHEIPGRLQELDPDQPVACLCHHGARSMSVAAFLINHGFEDVSNITGGIDAWSLSADPGVPRY